MTLYINKNNPTATITLNLYTRLINENTWFLFVFKRSEFGIEFQVPLIDQSTYPRSFSEFEIQTNLFEKVGFYDYFVYQIASSAVEDQIKTNENFIMASRIMVEGNNEIAKVMANSPIIKKANG